MEEGGADVAPLSHVCRRLTSAVSLNPKNRSPYLVVPTPSTSSQLEHGPPEMSSSKQSHGHPFRYERLGAAVETVQIP